MRTVAEIINLLSGIDSLRQHPIKIEVPGYERLCIDHIGTGPRGLPMISIAHYFEQHGDLVQDPDLVVELLADADGKVSGDIGEWGIVSIQHPFGPVVRACWVDEDTGKILVNERQVRDIRIFASVWSRNLKAQGFMDAFRASLS